MRHGLSNDEINQVTSFDPWFLARIREIIDVEAQSLQLFASKATHNGDATFDRVGSPTKEVNEITTEPSASSRRTIKATDGLNPSIRQSVKATT